ncbi:MAG: hypothetical protein M1819_000429 [Sarea resinae]|nr:MAG: hypothetical protein M1819_000429 [Sarea resinae]
MDAQGNASRQSIDERLSLVEEYANKTSGENSFFQNPSVANATPAMANTLNKLFNKYRDSPEESPDTIGVEGAMKYLGDLGVNLDEVTVLAISEALQAPTMGEFNREGFVDGWRSLDADTIPNQQAAVSQLRANLTADRELFKRVYKYTFFLARLPGQKAVALDAAIEYWRLLFQPPSVSWNTDETPWLDWFIEFLQSRWKKTVNRDMWDMTYVFFQRSTEDESMSWWDENGAWPGVLDDFVLYVREKRGQDGRMDVE